MENEFEITGDSKLEEKKAVDSEVVDLSNMESSQLRFDESLNSDSDELFEETVEAESPESLSEITTGQSGNTERIGSLENNNGNLHIYSGTSGCYEVVGTASLVQSSEDSGAKTELMSKEDHDENQIASEKIVRDEINELMEGCFTDIGSTIIQTMKTDDGEYVDSDAIDFETKNLNDINEANEKSSDPNQDPEVDSDAIDGQTENLNDRNDTYEMSSNLNQHPEDGISYKLSYAEVVKTVTRELIIETSESIAPTDIQKLEKEKCTDEMQEVLDANEVNVSENDLPNNVDSVLSLDHEYMKSNHAGGAVNDQILEVLLENEGENNLELNEAGPRTDSNTSGDALHKNGKYALLSSQHPQTHVGELNDRINDISAENEGEDHLEGNDLGLRADSNTSGDALHKNGKYALLSSQHPQTHVGELNNRINDISAENEGEDHLEGNDLGLRADSNTNGDALRKNEKDAILNSQHQQTHAVAVNDQIHEISAEAEGEDYLKGNETGLRADFNSNGDAVHKNETDAILYSEYHQDKHDRTSENRHSEPKENDPDDHGKKSSLTEEGKKLNILGSEEIDVEIADEEENSGTTSAQPLGLEGAAQLQKQVHHDTSAGAEKKVKPAADVSSAADNITYRSVGTRHTAFLPDPASQSKVPLSMLPADTPKTNITSGTPARPAGLGRGAPLLEPSSRAPHQTRANGAVSETQNQLIEDPTNGEAEEYDETREKLQMIRIKFLRLAHRLGQTPHNVVVAQVLYRLGLAEQLHGRSARHAAAFSFDRASAMAEQLEAVGQEPLDFTCTIMVLGKSGVGKSATINSIFDEVMFTTDAFQSGTKKVQDIVGTVQGIRVRVVDTPGLLPSWSDQHQNEKILHSVKRFIKKTPPDIVLYLDRLDMQNRDFGDMPLLRTITEIFGPSIWFNAIVVLTHAASAPPEGSNGIATSYDMFVTQRSHVVQQAIRQAAGDTRLMNPVSLVENHSACRTNRAGQRVLPNGQVWKPHLLLLSFASKILSEANTLLKLQDTPPGRPFAPRSRSPPLPFLLSSLLQSRPEVKLPSEHFGGGDDDDDDGIEDDLDECLDLEEESEYDELPSFVALSKAQLEKLTKLQRDAYYDELEYREKLFMKKQLKGERRRRQMMKKMREAAKDLPAEYTENSEEEASSTAASVPVPMPDLALPATFDADNPTHRYRSLDSSTPWLVRAVLEPNGWDHDIGYDGINVERLFVVNSAMPISFSGHISKDKKDTNLQVEVASSVKHGRGKATSLGFDMQSVGKDYAYTVRSETRFSNNRINKATAGLSATVLGDVLTGGFKLEDKLIIGKQGQLIVSGGAIYGRGEVAYGSSLEATLRDKDHILGRFLSTFGLSIMDWHGDLAIGCNSQTQIPIGRHTNLIGRFNINNRGSGQFSLRLNSSEQLQIVLVGLIPLVKKLLGYFQQVQYG